MQREHELQELARTDSLTGLLNRRGFDQVLEEVWHATVRAGTQMSLLLLDIDHFKNFNDLYGHPAGDDCLRAVATAVSGSLSRTSDRAARYGGEELAIVLPGTDAEGAIKLAEQIRLAVLALRLPHPKAFEQPGFLTVSVGVATALARHGGSMRMPESLLLTADMALYKAKREGRNRAAPMLLVAASNQ
ncbi:MAG: GGDEF domain-containing protein [Janthinobacterium lividum]